MPRAVRLSTSERKKLKLHIRDSWYETKVEWQPWVDNLPRWQKAYRNHTERMMKPWPDAANFHLPVTTIGVERMESAYHNVLRPADLFELQPTERADVDRASNVGRFINQAFQGEMNAIPTLERIAHRTALNGRQVAITRWARCREKVVEGWPVPISEIGSRDPEAVALYYFGPKLREVSRIDSLAAKVSFLDKRNVLQEGMIEILSDEERGVDASEDEIEFEVSYYKIVKDCPVIDLPAPDDFIVTADGDTIHDASEMFYTRWVTFDELAYNFENGLWDDPDDPDLFDKLKDANDKLASSGTDQLHSPNRTWSDDTSTIRVTQAIRRFRFQHMQVFLRWDVDNDGHRERVIVDVLWDPTGEPRILRISHLRTEYPYDEWPVSVFDFIPKMDVPAAMGVAEFIAPIQAELNFTHNNRANANQIRVSPFFFYETGSALAPRKLRISPGDGIPIDRAGSVYFPPVNGSDAGEVQREMQMLGLLERMLPVNDIASGRNPGSRITAHGTDILMAQNMEIWDKHMKRFGRGVASCGKQAMMLYAANAPRSLEFRVTGTNEFQTLRRDDLRNDRDFVVHSAAIHSTGALRRQFAIQKWALFSQDPQIASRPRSRWKLMMDVLKALDEPDPLQIAGPPPAEGDNLRLTPEQEQAMFAQGLPSEPNIEEDHELYIQEHEAFLASPRADGHPQARQLALENIQIRIQILNTQQQAQALQLVPGQGSAPGLGADPMANGLPPGPGLGNAAPQDAASLAAAGSGFNNGGIG